jgi:hypothetical protein
VDDPFCKAALFFHDKSIVRAGYQKDVGDLPGHELMKDLERKIEIRGI